MPPGVAQEGLDRPVAGPWGLYPEDLLAAALGVAFVVVSLVLGRPLRMPWMGGPVLVSCLLLLAQGMGSHAYLRARRAGLPPGAALRGAGQRAGEAVRALAPLLLGMLFFEGLRTLTPFASPQTVDAWMVEADRLLLGGRDVAVLMDRLGHPFVTDVLGLAYAIDLVTIPLVVAFLHARGQRRAAQHVSLSLLTLHALGIIGYYAVPVVGPYLYQAELLADRFPGGGGQGLALIEVLRGAARDCFPSLHVGHVVVIGLLLRRHARLIYWCYLPLGAAVIVSTLYLRVHYLVDLLAGVPVALVSLRIATALLDRRRQPFPAPARAVTAPERRSA